MHTADGLNIPIFDGSTDKTTGTPVNLASAWLDGSVIYGISAEHESKLRTVFKFLASPNISPEVDIFSIFWELCSSFEKLFLLFSEASKLERRENEFRESKGIFNREFGEWKCTVTLSTNLKTSLRSWNNGTLLSCDRYGFAFSANYREIKYELRVWLIRIAKVCCKTIERESEECTCDVPSTDFADFMMKGPTYKAEEQRFLIGNLYANHNPFLLSISIIWHKECLFLIKRIIFRYCT